MNDLKIKLLHVSYFGALVALSFLSFFILLGAGFVGNINVFILLIPFVLSVAWLSDYIWRFLSMKSKEDKLQLIEPAKNGAFILLFLSGVLIVYGLFLTTLFPTPIEDVPPWLFLGIPVMLLLMWYGLLYRYTKNKTDKIQMVFGSFLVIVSLVYAYKICDFYVLQFL
ncbi:hypothetical protein MUN88_04745 [Gracilibacillus caseinilyticus]|uniref:Tripartite tricarboxylate transporter TctB family protein n=1 Tax=Gracilibacillus caseinilyticus TaxID=2932256 RepID=A0ABY4EYD2_9BACI|nr:hypothetical protein [Gracilibacillus caseinilyticus]UOQ49417.1 hypothetical protein MUN88_04745 [Gracilibacillus caseinilyticus]